MENRDLSLPLFLSPLATGGKGWLLVTGRCRFVSARAPPHSRKLRSSPFSSFLYSSVSLLSFRFLFRREQCRFPVAIVREERSIFFLPSPLCRRFRETSLSPTEWPLTVTGTLSRNIELQSSAENRDRGRDDSTIIYSLSTHIDLKIVIVKSVTATRVLHR